MHVQWIDPANSKRANIPDNDGFQYDYQSHQEKNANHTKQCTGNVDGIKKLRHD